MDIPEPRQPSLSGYVSAEKRLLPWAWVDARMAAARNYWVATHARGFPCARPVWGLWWSPRFAFSTGGALGRNLARDARAQIHLESGDELVIVEGIASPGLAPEETSRWADEYRAKYHWGEPPAADEVIVVRPVRVLAWLCDSSGLDGGVGFGNSATEWRFE